MIVFLLAQVAVLACALSAPPENALAWAVAASVALVGLALALLALAARWKALARVLPAGAGSAPRLAATLFGGILLAGFGLHGLEVRRTRAPESLSERAGPLALAVPVVLEATVRARPRASPRTPNSYWISLAGAPGCRWIDAGDLPPVGARVRVHGLLAADRKSVRARGPQGLVVLAPPAPSDWRARAESWRNTLDLRLARGLSPRAYAYARALLLGLRDLPPETAASLAGTGVLHLFAVSGLHVALLAAALERLLGRRSVAILPLLTLYGALAGWQPPVLRALAILGAAQIARRCEREPRPSTHLALAAALVLAWDPLAFTRIGAQLSFAAYAGLGWLVPRAEALPSLAPRWLRLWRAVRSALLVSLAAWVAGSPLLAWHFGTGSLVAIPASVLLGPLVPFLMAAALLHVAAPGLPFGALCLEAGSALFEIALRWLDALPGTPMAMVRPHPIPFALATAALVRLGLAIQRRRTRPTTRTAPAWIAVGLTQVLLMAPHPPPEGLHLLPAGRGQALLATSAAGAVLLDAGPPEARIAQGLAQRGLGRLDASILTHSHADHAGGAAEVYARFAPEQRFGSAASPVFGHTKLARGDRPLSGIEVLWPPAPEPSSADLGNAGSLVLHWTGGGPEALVPGDLTSAEARAWLAAGPVPQAAILVLPHHGAWTEGSAEVLLRARPQSLWLSASPGFPDLGTLALALWSDCDLQLPPARR